MSIANVLVVEDESIVALDICQGLKRYGYGVFGPVATGEAAIQKAKELRPDVVLMDIMLKGPMDGIQAASQISDMTNIPIIFLTAHADKTTLERAKITEPYAYVVKPFEDSALHAALEITLYKHQSLVPRNGTANGDFTNGSAAADRKRTLPELTLPERVEFLRSIKFFSDLGEDELKLLARACTEQTLKGAEFLHAGNPQETPAFVLRSGRMAMVEFGPEGKELIVELVGPGDLFGLIAAVQQFPTQLQARAYQPTDVLLIPRKTFLLLLEAHPQMGLQFARYVSHRLRDSQVLARAIAYDDVYSRIAAVLAALVPRFGRQKAESPNYLIDITRQELASLTGMTVETVVRVIKTMEQAGAIGPGRRKQIEIADLNLLSTFSQPSKKNSAAAM